MATAYPAQGIPVLLSRAWNLMRLNLRDALRAMLPPTILYNLFLLLFILPGSRTFLTPTSTSALTLAMASSVVSLLVFVFFVFSCVLASCQLARYYFSLLLQENRSLAQCAEDLRGVRKGLILFTLTASLLALGFLVMDGWLFWQATQLTLWAFTTLGGFGVLGSGMFMLTVVFFCFMLWGFTVLALAIVLGCAQTGLLVFPFLALSTASERPEISLASIREAWRLLRASFGDLLLFGLGLFLFASAVAIPLQAPALFWLWEERPGESLAQLHRLPLYLTLAVNIWLSLVNLLLMPYYISAITMFWYHCRVRKAGLDLQLWLERMMRRRAPQTVEE